MRLTRVAANRTISEYPMATGISGSVIWMGTPSASSPEMIVLHPF
jgi:hypothetical protein